MRSSAELDNCLQAILKLRREGSFDKALVKLAEFQELKPKSDQDLAVMYGLRGSILDDMGKKEMALTEYRLASTLAPRSRLASSALFNCLIECSCVDEAINEGLRFFSGPKNSLTEKSREYFERLKRCIALSQEEREELDEYYFLERKAGIIRPSS